MQFKNFLWLSCLCVFSVALTSWTYNKIDSENELSSAIKTTLLSTKTITENKLKTNSISFVYDSLELEKKGLSQNAFEYAIEGFQKLDEDGALKNDSVLTIIDFDQPSYKKRMYIIDVRNFKILFNTLVAHGKNTGKEIAQFFSNSSDSYKSSLGFYVTNETYNGSKGYSLKLIGMEPGLNNNAFSRAIVIHGAPYVSESYISDQGYIGRSHGCPAVPTELARPIIQTIKNGSCLFIYNKAYKPTSHFKVG